MAFEQQTRDRLISPVRGQILDRNNTPIATSKSVSAISVIHAQVKEPEKVAKILSEKYDIITATEVGGGVVPVDATERANREKAGRLACLLAARADCVVQMFCGIPTVLKGELPK